MIELIFIAILGVTAISLQALNLFREKKLEAREAANWKRDYEEAMRNA